MKTTDAKAMSREQLEAYCAALEEQVKSLSEENGVIGDLLTEMTERAERAEGERGEDKELRRLLHILYHDFAEALVGWRRIADRIRTDGKRAFEALRTGGNVEGRIYDTVRWAGAIERKTGEQAAALGLIKEIAEAATGDWLYLLDDIDD